MCMTGFFWLQLVTEYHQAPKRVNDSAIDQSQTHLFVVNEYQAITNTNHAMSYHVLMLG